MSAVLIISKTFFTFIYALTIFLCLEPRTILAQNGHLPEEENNALREIAHQLGKKDWDFNLNPCDGNPNWTTPKRDYRQGYNNSVICNCSYPDAVCHVEEICLTGQDLAGVLPPSLAKLPYLKRIDLTWNYLNGTIPPEWASTKLEYMYVFGNRLSGPIPKYLGNIMTLVLITLTANNLTGELPMELNNLKKLRFLLWEQCSWLGSNHFTGKMPCFESLTKFQSLDLSFNKLEGEIPNLGNLTNLSYIYLTGNSLTGRVLDWILNRGENRNLFRSYDGGKSNELGKCPSPCSKDYYSFHVNCGGQNVKIVNTEFEWDAEPKDSTRYIPRRDNWGTSSTRIFWKPGLTSNEYLAKNVSSLRVNDTELYTTALLSPLSLTYCRCLANGKYTVTLHFAEVVFKDSQSYISLGRRIFYVYIQGERRIKDFNIEDEVKGVDKVVKRNFSVMVENKTLEIRFQYTGKGTTIVPIPGTYSPLISAISVNSDKSKLPQTILILLEKLGKVVLDPFTRHIIGWYNYRCEAVFVPIKAREP